MALFSIENIFLLRDLVFNWYWLISILDNFNNFQTFLLIFFFFLLLLIFFYLWNIIKIKVRMNKTSHFSLFILPSLFTILNGVNLWLLFFFFVFKLDDH